MSLMSSHKLSFTILSICHKQMVAIAKRQPNFTY